MSGLLIYRCVVVHVDDVMIGFLLFRVLCVFLKVFASFYWFNWCV